MSEGVTVHPQALCESEDVGAGTRVWAFAHILAGARVGAGCNVGDHAYVEGGAVVGNNVTIKNGVLIWNGVTIEDDVFVGPGAVFTNDRKPRAGFKKPVDDYLVKTVVRRGASIGANATILCGVTLGEAAFVGAGSVVVDDVASRALVVGNPARQIGWICDCGERLPAGALTCAECGRSYTEGSAGLTLRA